MKPLTSLLIIFAVIGAVLMVRLSLPYIHLLPDTDFLQTKAFAYSVPLWRYSFYTHVFSSSFVLIAGIIQFVPYVVQNLPRLHKIAGYTYCTGILFVSGPSGLVMAFFANGGTSARISFVLLSILWWFTTARALQLARNKKWVEHVAWMARSYGLTLSAVTLRTYALGIGLLHLDIRPIHAYILISWLSWTINLIIAEIWIRTGGPGKLINRRH